MNVLKTVNNFNEDKLSKLGFSEQEKTGTFYMKETVDPAHIANIDRGISQHSEKIEYLEKTIETREKNNKTGVTICPTGFTIIVKPYAENPYTPIIHKLEGSNLLYAPTIGLDGIYDSRETGNVETADQLPCGKIIKVGPECKYCKEGEDVYYRPGAVPIPVFGLGYYAVSEQNIICRLIK